MRVLVTGHEGYIGAVMTPMLTAAGHEVVGLDVGFFTDDCNFGPGPVAIPGIQRDLRDIGPADLEGFDAVIHLAALSNDPMGDLRPDITYAINHAASMEVARLAKAAGVTRFLFSSSCSLYGAGGDGLLDESAGFNPVTPYGHSKVMMEEGLAALADDSFSPTYLRNATAFGPSPRLRTDVVVNNLSAVAWTTGQVLLRSDGTAWRPLVHVEDICRAFTVMLSAPRELVHDQAFNIGATTENYRIREIAELVQAEIKGSEVTFSSGAGTDLRNYRVSFDKLADTLPDAKPRWTVRDGIQQLVAGFEANGLAAEDVESPRFVRMRQISRLRDGGRLDEDLRWESEAQVPVEVNG